MYLAIAEVAARAEMAERSLEEYLRALFRVAARWRNRDSVEPPEFVVLLSEALSAPPEAFDDAWAREYASSPEEEGYAGWSRTLTRQIVDLREMEVAGMLKNPMRYFGLSAPEGFHWYNFDIGTYLECAAAGTWGGWREGDPTLLDGEDPILELQAISWDTFASFLWFGQSHE